VRDAKHAVRTRDVALCLVARLAREQPHPDSAPRPPR
jgi:hypothetical protein